MLITWHTSLRQKDQARRRRYVYKSFIRAWVVRSGCVLMGGMLCLAHPMIRR